MPQSTSKETVRTCSIKVQQSMTAQNYDTICEQITSSYLVKEKIPINYDKNIFVYSIYCSNMRKSPNLFHAF
jgi:hypothetical protein